MDAAKVSKRRTFGGASNGVAVSAASAPATPLAEAMAAEEPETRPPSHLPPSPYSAAPTGTRRHARAGASARSATAAASEAAAADEASSVDAPGGGEWQKHHTRKNSNGNSNGSSNPLRNTGAAATGPAAAPVAAAGLLWRRARRLLWTFWRRRAVVSLRANLEHKLSRVLRHIWGRRLVFAAAVVLAGLFWFLVITAVVGPAGGGGGGKNGAKDGDGGERPYYRRIVGEVAVGPSLSDPWMVREIDIAAADWGSFHDGSSADGGGDGSSGSGGSGGAREGGAIGSEAGGGRKRDEWDGRVNGVVTGELEPIGAKTRPKVDLLLTIFSGSTEVINLCM